MKTTTQTFTYYEMYTNRVWSCEDEVRGYPNGLCFRTEEMALDALEAWLMRHLGDLEFLGTLGLKPYEDSVKRHLFEKLHGPGIQHQFRVHSAEVVRRPQEVLLVTTRDIRWYRKYSKKSIDVIEGFRVESSLEKIQVIEDWKPWKGQYDRSRDVRSNSSMACNVKCTTIDLVWVDSLEDDDAQ